MIQKRLLSLVFFALHLSKAGVPPASRGVLFYCCRMPYTKGIWVMVGFGGASLNATLLLGCPKDFELKGCTLNVLTMHMKML